jgi:hypothetical protein
MDWMAARIPCRACGPVPGYSGAPGSFLKPLIWWTFANGKSLEKQLDFADQKLLEYETLIHAEWRMT